MHTHEGMLTHKIEHKNESKPEDDEEKEVGNTTQFSCVCVYGAEQHHLPPQVIGSTTGTTYFYYTSMYSEGGEIFHAVSPEFE